MLMPKRKNKKRFHYITFSLATVLFWRGIWHILDKIPIINGYLISDIISVFVGVILLWWVSRGFKNIY